VVDAERKPWHKRWRRRLGSGLAGVLGPPLLRLLAASWRVHVVGQENWDAAVRDGRLPVFALWHESIPAGALLHRHRALTVLVSRHRDGALVARLIERLGFRTIRGSTFDGADGALRELLREARTERGLVLTPDGPRGPAHAVAGGALYLAGASGRPLVATGFAASRAWRAGSWDRMIFPKLFARIVIAYALPLDVPRGAAREPEASAAARTALLERFAGAHARADAALAAWRDGAAPESEA